MKIEVLQENLKKSLGVVQKAISTKPQLPILSTVLLEVAKDKITLSTTDLYLGIKAEVAGKVTEIGKTAIPGKLFYNIIASLDPGKISLNVEKDVLVIKSQNSKSNISCFSPDEFPDFPAVNGQNHQIKASLLKEIKQKISYCASTDLTRPILTALLFSFTNDVLMTVGTDGFRLATFSQQLEKKVEQEKFLIPAKAIDEVVSVLSDQQQEVVFFVYSSELQQVKFIINGVEIYIRLIQGDYPPFEKIIPADFIIEAEMDGQDLEDQLKRAQVFAREASNIIKLKLTKDKMIVSASSPAYGNHEGSLLINLKKGEGGEIAFNARYLIDFINSLHPTKVSFYMNESLTPAMIKPTTEEKYQYIIMPFRVNQ